MIECFLPFQLLFSHQVMSNSLWHHGLHHTRLPCPSYLPELPQTQVLWVGDAIQPFHPLSASFPPALNPSQNQDLFMNRLFTSGGQSIRTSSSASVLPVNIQAWFSLGLTGLISLQSKKLFRVCSSDTIQKHQFFRVQPSLWSSSHIHTWLIWLLKNHSLDCTNLWWQSDVSAVEYALCICHSFSSKEQCLLISWLRSLSTVTLEPKKIKSAPVSTFCPFICHEWWDQMPWS